VTCLEDIFAALEPLPDSVREATLFPEPVAAEEKQGPSPSKFDGLGDPQRLILEHMGQDETNVDGLADATGLEVGVILRELTFLSLKGLVKRLDGQTFVRGRAR
jgi:predicted Rossmann fold nucleotide-binding protein DprA/Smf involved in DNA uptake